MSVSSDEFKQSLRRLATGVAIVTTSWQGQTYGMTVNSFTSVSLDPPLVLFCAYPEGHTCQAILTSHTYGVSILAADQLDLCQRFAGQTASKEDDRFSGVTTDLSPNLSLPWISGCLTWLECRLLDHWTAGDHLILLGQVISTRLGQPLQPLLYFNGQWPALKP